MKPRRGTLAGNRNLEGENNLASRSTNQGGDFTDRANVRPLATKWESALTFESFLSFDEGGRCLTATKTQWTKKE